MIDEEFEEIELSQLVDSPLRVVRQGGFFFRFGSLRSADARDRNSGGQDFVAVRHSPRGLVFALCDGVAGSFSGELAALFLGRSVLDWFTDSETENVEPDQVEARLGQYLAGLTTTATRQVQAVSIPQGVAPAIANVLEAKRDLGSEAMFVAGRVDLPGPGAEGHVALAWMGDMRLRVFHGADDVRLSPRDETATRQRWSTRRGPVAGRPAAWMCRFGPTEPLRILAYSDGLKPLDEIVDPLPDDRLQDMMDSWREGPETDDMSVLEIWRDLAERRPPTEPRRWNAPRVSYG